MTNILITLQRSSREDSQSIGYTKTTTHLPFQLSVKSVGIQQKSFFMSELDFPAHCRKIIPFPVSEFKSPQISPSPYCRFSTLGRQVLHADTRRGSLFRHKIHQKMFFVVIQQLLTTIGRKVQSLPENLMEMFAK